MILLFLCAIMKQTKQWGDNMVLNVMDKHIDLSYLISLLENKKESLITVTKNGVPVARIIPCENELPPRKLGLAKGKFSIPDDFDDTDEELVKMMMEGNI